MKTPLIKNEDNILIKIKNEDMTNDIGSLHWLPLSLKWNKQIKIYNLATWYLINQLNNVKWLNNLIKIIK